MTLTDEILDKISDYEMEQISAEANVITSHMEACLRDIQICRECENAGIVMESNSILPKRGEDENIILYIFRFIPSLIINLMRKFMAWITGVKEPDTEAMEKLKKAAELRADGEKFIHGFCTTFNRMIKKTYPDTEGNISYLDGKFIYNWRIKSTGAVKNNLDRFSEFFDGYKAIFDKLLEYGLEPFPSDSDLEEVEKIEILSSVYIENDERIVSAFSDDASNFIGLEDAEEEVVNLKKDIDPVINKIKAQMLNIVDNYHKLDKTRVYLIFKNPNMNLADKYRKSVDKLYAEFSRFESTLEADLKPLTNINKNIDIAYTAYMKTFEDSDIEKLRQGGYIKDGH